MTERLQQVGEHVVRVLETDRQAQQPGVGLRLTGHRTVGQCRGVLDQGVDATQ